MATKIQNTLPKNVEINHNKEEKLINQSENKQKLFKKKSFNRTKKGNITKKISSSWGYAETPLRDPCNYLKKYEGYRLIKQSSHKCDNNFKRKPPVPRLSKLKTIKVTLEKPQKNYKLENIKMLKNDEIIKKKSKRILKYVDTRSGHTKPVLNSGLIPEYTRDNPNYGKVPVYIKRIKKLIEKYKKQMLKENSKEIPEKNKSKLISEEERQEILAGMRKNLKELYATYQRLPVCIDTESKKQRKVHLEQELNKIEKDILFIENNPLICVIDDDD